MIARANGVGPKLALRIATELKDKVGGLALGTGSVTVSRGGCHGEDAVSALMNLGFRPGDARTDVAAAESGLGAEPSLDALVPLGLNTSGRWRLIRERRRPHDR